MNFRLIHHQFDNLSGQPSALFRLKCIHAQKLIFRVVVVVETREREWRFYFHFAANDRHIANRKLYTFIRDSFILARQWSIDIDTNKMCVLKTLNFCLVSKWLFGEIPQVLTCVCVWVCKCMVCYARLSFGLHEFIYLSISLLMGHSHVININWLTLTHTHTTHTHWRRALKRLIGFHFVVIGAEDGLFIYFYAMNLFDFRYKINIQQ